MSKDDYEEGEILDKKAERKSSNRSSHDHHRHHSRSHHSHRSSDKDHRNYRSHSKKRNRQYKLSYLHVNRSNSRSRSSKRRRVESKGILNNKDSESNNKKPKEEENKSHSLKEEINPFSQENNNLIHPISSKENNNNNNDDSDSPLEDINLFEDEEEKLKEAEKRRERLLLLLSQTKNEEIEKESEKDIENVEKQIQPKPQPKSQQPSENEIKKESEKKVTASIEFDMFSDEIPNTNNTNNTSTNNIQLNYSNSEMFDNDEGYYICRVGELFYNRYRVLGEFGKGVFSTVLKCEDTLNNNFNVAIKVIRSNEIMTKEAQSEVKIIELISLKDPQHNKHCMRILDTFIYRKHYCIVFNIMSMNLRELLNKYGRNIGLHLDAVKVYGYQLFTALKHIHSINIIHADLKPDNILVNEEKNSIQLADFGSAIFTDGANEVTPYLVSRYYRAPEVILGLKYSCPIDIWSAGCCLYELYTGMVMFPGNSNNEMIKLFQEIKGQFSKKIISQHYTAYDLLKKCYYFVDGYFIYQTVDAASGLAKFEKKKYDICKPERDIKNELLSKANKNEDKQKILNLCDLLLKCFALDPLKRITAEDALKHPFFKQDELKIPSTPVTPKN